MSTHTLNSRPLSTKNIVIAAVVAAVLDLAIFGLASWAGADWQVGQPTPVNAAIVAAQSAVPMTIGAFIAAAIAKKRPGFMRFARWFGLALIVLTVAGAVTAPSQPLTAVSLVLMHVVVAGAWLWLTRPRFTD